MGENKILVLISDISNDEDRHLIGEAVLSLKAGAFLAAYIMTTTQSIFEVIVSNPGIKQKVLCDRLGISAASAKRHIVLLEAFIEYRGSKKTGGYYVKEQGSDCFADGEC